MWEEEKKRKGRTERLFSNGVIILVFLILTAQAVFFTRHLIINSRRAETGTASGTVSTQGRPPSSDTAGIVRYPSVNERQGAEPGGRNAVAATGQYGSTGSVDKNKVPQDGPADAAGTGAAVSVGDVSATGTESRRYEYDYDGWKWDMVELNSADSAALDALPGIGPWYAKQILSYRERLGSYADVSQLLDIRGFDTARLNRLYDYVFIEPSSVRRLDLRTMSVDSMASHPYIGPYAAKGIDRFRRTVPDSVFSLQAIVENGILSGMQARRLSLYMRRD